MGERRQKIILFLCTGNYYRSRFAEIMFNSLAKTMGLPWKASSRGLALERGVNNIGPMALAAVEALRSRGLGDTADYARMPERVTAADLESADWIVGLKQMEHLPLLQERFPEWAEKVEYWQVHDSVEALALIEREIMDLIARLIGGGKQRIAAAQQIVSEAAGAPPKKVVKKITSPVVRLGRETKGRRGKGVTIVSDLPLAHAELLEVAAKLKQRCGTGGTVKDGRIEIQGDQRDRLATELQMMGYQVKRVGG